MTAAFASRHIGTDDICAGVDAERAWGMPQPRRFDGRCGAGAFAYGRNRSTQLIPAAASECSRSAG